MTPKEKAEELYNKYYQFIADSSYPEEMAKLCALIAVEDIIHSLVIIPFGMQYINAIDYWEEVKEEIKNL